MAWSDPQERNVLLALVWQCAASWQLSIVTSTIDVRVYTLFTWLLLLPRACTLQRFVQRLNCKPLMELTWGCFSDLILVQLQ